MRADARTRLAALTLVAAVAVGLCGCALLEFVVGPSNETLWTNDLHVAEMLAEHMAGTDGYYLKDAATPAAERKKLADDLLDTLNKLKGETQAAGTRRGLEARLAVHAKRFPAYIDRDVAWSPTEKKELRDPIEKWLGRVSEGH